jgi:hypothetical protein
MADASATDVTYAVIELREGPTWAAGVSVSLVGLHPMARVRLRSPAACGPPGRQRNTD